MRGGAIGYRGGRGMGIDNGRGRGNGVIILSEEVN